MKAIVFSNIKVPFEIIEDNGGGLHLVIFSQDKEKVMGYYSDFEYCVGTLMYSLGQLYIDPEAWMMWENNSDYPQRDYDEIISSNEWSIVADNDGIYPDKMGKSAMIEFAIEK